MDALTAAVLVVFVVEIKLVLFILAYSTGIVARRFTFSSNMRRTLCS